MQKLLSMVSDLEFERELILGLKNRVIDQKFGYMSEGARLYYDSLDRDPEGPVLFESSKLDLIVKTIPSGQPVALVSLGCGNSGEEFGLLSRLNSEGKKVEYFGVDSSRSMLDLSAKRFEGSDLKCNFILADLTTDDLRDELNRLTSRFGTRIFAFLGATFGNMNQTNVADSLWNILKPSDSLWLHVHVRPSLKTVDDMKLFNLYASYLQEEKTASRFFHPLRQVGVPFGCGKMQLATDKEESVGAMVFKYSFVFSQKTIITYRGEKLHFLPGEKVDLLSIRVYHEKTLIDFFSEHEFDLQSVQLEPIADGVIEGQFIFKKSV